VLNLFAFFFYFLVSKKARRILGALEYTIGITTFAGLFVSAVALVSGADLASPKGYEWAVLLFIAIIPGTGGHFLFNWAHAHTTALVVAIMGLLVPVLASAGAFVFLNENLSTWQLVGGSIVLLATGMVARMRH
jgi:drug/metabolite transporter (DMT)-like permease